MRKIYDVLSIDQGSRELLRFAAAGATNTALTYGIYSALLLVVSYPIAYTASYVAGIFISYFLNCTFVFRCAVTLRSALRFPLVYVVQYVLGFVLLTLCVNAFNLSPRIAALVVVFFSIPITFVLSRFVVRQAPKPPARAEI